MTESRPVEVLHDGRWYPGTLDRWKHDERGWVGHVWWSEGVGLTHVEWIKAERLRPAPGPGGPTIGSLTLKAPLESSSTDNR